LITSHPHPQQDEKEQNNDSHCRKL